MTERTRLSSKGQIIIPKSFRLSKGLKAGDEFLVQEFGGAILLSPLKPFETTKIESVFGCLPYHGPALSLEEMEAGISEGARTFNDRP